MKPETTAGLRVVVTGGIGSGKSTVAALLGEAGARLFDADAVSRALTAPGGRALPAIAAAFGPQVLGPDGALDRKRMRSLVFSRSEARRELEAILHPLIAQQADEADQETGPRPLVYDIPLLGPRSAWRRKASRVLVLDCLEATQVARVMQRSALTEEEVRRVMASQVDRATRRRLADAVVFNDGLNLSELAREVHGIWSRWTAHG